MACSIAYPEVSRESLNKSIELLTSVEWTDVHFLSCYLGIESGQVSCMDFLEAESASIRAGLSEMDKIVFDSAYEYVRTEVSNRWSPQIKGLAIFARSIIGGKFISVIPSTFAFRDQLTYYAVPDVRLLVSLRDAYQHDVRTPDTNARELHLQGGVVGLKRDSATVAVMPRPLTPAVTKLVA